MILETLLKPFIPATRIALRPILHRQERINRAFLRRFKQMATTLADVQTAATSLTASGNALSEAAKAIIGELQTAQTPPDFTPIVAALTSVDSQIQGAVKALQDAVAPVPPAPPAAS